MKSLGTHILSDFNSTNYHCYYFQGCLCPRCPLEFLSSCFYSRQQGRENEKGQSDLSPAVIPPLRWFFQKSLPTISGCMIITQLHGHSLLWRILGNVLFWLGTLQLPNNVRTLLVSKMGRMNVERQLGVYATNIDYLCEQGNFQEKGSTLRSMGNWL